VSLMPRTLAGRVFLVIIAGLIVAHLASYALFEVERTRSLERFSAAEVAARIVDATRNPPAAFNAAAREPAPRRFREGAGFDGPPVRHRIRWHEVAELPTAPSPGAAPSAGFESELRRLLVESLGEDPVAWMSVRNGPPPAESHVSDTPPDVPRGGEPRMGPRGDRSMGLLTVGLKLPANRFATAETPIFTPTRGIPTEAWTSVALVFIVTAMFTLVAARLAVGPVRLLADAADRLSRNIDEPPLPEKGAQELRSATRAFNRMQDRLKRHVNSRALAFAAMSHDIRTPLTRMRLRLETLGPEAKERIGEDLDEIEAIARSVLEISRGLSAEEPICAVDLDAMVKRIAQDYAAMGSAVEVSGHAGAIAARPAALKRAVGNLVDNALKYGREVAVDLQQSRSHVTLAVCDRGPGIPASELPKVTTPFYRVESSRNRDTGGAGLGLAIARDLVEGQGGELTLANREGGGLVATLRLPR
jgi:signal transduction histidine kinase